MSIRVDMVKVMQSSAIRGATQVAAEKLRTLNSLVKFKKDQSEELAELQAIFDLRWKADMRAIKRWQAAGPGREKTWPDHADLVVWLLEQLEGQDDGICH